MTGKKIKIGVLILLAVSVALLGWRSALFAVSQPPEPVDTSEGISFLAALEAEDVAARKAAIAAKRAEQEKPTPPATPTEATPTDATPSDATPSDAAKDAPPANAAPHHVVKDGNYRRAFGDILISGDSLVKAITEFGLLDEDQVIAKVGARVSFLNENTQQIAAAAPAYLILHYGENDLDDPPRVADFVRSYAAVIRDLQALLPDTVILVDSIFPVEDFACVEEPWLKHIDEYNAGLREMCAGLGVTFLDFTPQWQSYEKDYYDGDGIHPAYSYYTEQYLPYLITEVNKH